MKKKVYLVGSIQDVKDPQKARAAVENALLEAGFDVLNPCKFETNHSLADDIEDQKVKLLNLKKGGAWEKFDKVMNGILLADEIAVISSEFIVVFWDVTKRHGGTIHEIIMAYEHNIPIFTVCYDPISEFNDWILCVLRRNFKVGGRIFENNKQCIDHIEKEYKDYIKEQNQLKAA